jgi:hypothetical protein
VYFAGIDHRVTAFQSGSAGLDYERQPAVPFPVLTWCVPFKGCRPARFLLPRLLLAAEADRRDVEAARGVEGAAEGHSNREIATVLGVDRETVNRDRRGANAPPPIRNRRNDDDDEAEGGANAPPAERPASKLNELVGKVISDLYDRRNCGAKLL